jgi:hypothetical protein
MKRATKNAILCLAFAVAGLPVPVSAEPPKQCSEGKLADGTCVDEKLGEGSRDLAQSMAQPKFSYSAPSRLPNRDRALGPGPNIKDLNALFKQFGLFGS